MSCSYIIPSAGRATRLFPLTANTPKVLVRLNGVPIFSLLYQQAVKYNCSNIIVAISKEFEHQFRDFISSNYANPIIPIITKVVDDCAKGNLYSIYTATRGWGCEDEVLIVLSDTLYTDELPNTSNFVMYEEVTPPLNRWCLIKTMDGEGYTSNIVSEFIDKPQGECSSNKALIGIYKLNRDHFNNCAERILYTGQPLNSEFQLSQALQQYIQNMPLGEVLIAQSTEPGCWHDTGTLENLRRASRNFMLTRNFNHIKIVDGFLIKSSEKKSVIYNQYLWYQNFKQKSLIPSIYNYDEKLDVAYLFMELCSMPDLGTYFTYCTAEPKFFEQVMESLLNIMSRDVWDYSFDPKNNVIGDSSNMEMFVKKTLERVPNCLREFPRWYELEQYLGEVAKQPMMSLIHGDFILSNVLFDPQRMTMKLIDPRGSYGSTGMYGDIRYDMAKMLTSLDGYDEIIHNMYKIEFNNENYDLVLYRSHQKAACYKAAKDVLFRFAREYNIVLADIIAIEISLIISMIPLHSEDKSRQDAFRIMAYDLLTNFYGE